MGRKRLPMTEEDGETKQSKMHCGKKHVPPPEAWKSGESAAVHPWLTRIRRVPSDHVQNSDRVYRILARINRMAKHLNVAKDSTERNRVNMLPDISNNTSTDHTYHGKVSHPYPPLSSESLPAAVRSAYKLSMAPSQKYRLSLAH